jgi:undecaprenyl pyrophosphate phosphatase UppP
MWCCAVYSFTRKVINALRNDEIAGVLVLRSKDGIMLGIIAAVLIVLWLLGFLAFHVASGFIHIVLVVGIILLVLHFMRSGTAGA